MNGMFGGKGPRALITLVAILAVMVVTGPSFGQNAARTIDVAPSVDKATIEPLIFPAPGEKEPNRHDPEDFVALTGAVTDEAGGAVANVWVNIFSDETGFGNGAETDENGGFEIEVPKGGGYDLFIDNYSVMERGLIGGFFKDADGGQGDDPGPDNAWTGDVVIEWEARTTIAVGDAGVTGIRVALNKGSRIFGKMVYEDGSPVADIWVDAHSENRGGWGGGVTDENGAFSITVAPGDGYRVGSWPWNGAFDGGFWREGEDSPLTESGRDGVMVGDYTDATLINMTSWAAGDVEINMILPTPTTISGRVIDTNGNPVNDIWVEAISGGKPWDEYEIMPPVVMPEPAFDENGNPIDENTDGDVSIMSADGMRADASIMPPIYPRDYGPRDYGPRYYGAMTDENGDYTIMVKPSDDYRVRVTAYEKEYYKDAATWKEATVIDVSETSASGINLTIDVGNTISGTITVLSDGEYGWLEAHSRSARSFGHAQVRGTDSGVVAYTIRMLAPADDFVVKFHSPNYVPMTVEGIDSSLNPTDVNFTVSEGETISGTITGLEPGEWLHVNAWNEGSRGFWGFDGGVADDNGTLTYEIKRLGGVGGYVVQATAGVKTLFYNQKFSVDAADRIDLSTGSKSGIDFDFSAIRTVKITGTVEGMESAFFGWIDAFSENGGAWGSAEFFGNGPFELEVVSGTYKIAFYARGYHPAYYDADAEGQLTREYREGDLVTVNEDTDLGTVVFSDDFRYAFPVYPTEPEPIFTIMREDGTPANGAVPAPDSSDARPAALEMTVKGLNLGF